MTDSEDYPWKVSQRSQPNPPKRNPLAGYDKEPKLYTVDGKDVPYYGLGAIAYVLGRKTDTMRKWEEQGHLPIPPVEFEGKNPDDVQSATHGRRRLYPEELILAIYDIAREENLLEHHNHPIKDTRFTVRVQALFREYEQRIQQNVVRRSYNRYEGHRKERA